jgi:hypothetical protein
MNINFVDDRIQLTLNQNRSSVSFRSSEISGRRIFLTASAEQQTLARIR